MFKTRNRMRSQDEWKKLIQVYENRAVSGSAWCKMHRVSYSNLKKWQKRLGSTSSSDRGEITESKLNFIPVSVQSMTGTSCCDLSVELKNGHKFYMKDASWDQVHALILQTVGARCS